MRPFGRLAAAALLVAVGSGCAPALFVNQRPDSILYPTPSHDTVTFWGHASIYVDVAGYGIVTDPVFGPRYSPLNGRRIPTPPDEAYRRTRVILISHAHQDHLQPSTLRRFPKGATILCPPPSEKYVRGLGPRVRVMRPGDEYRIPGGKIIAVLADHPGGRYSRKPKTDGGAVGYVIETPKVTLYYSGDTELFSGIEQIGQVYRPDIAILNVNAHLPPGDALAAAMALGVSRVIPSHYGAYGGRAGSRGRAFHREFDRLAGPLAIPLRVGESVAFDTLDVRTRPRPASPPWIAAMPAPAPVLGRGFLLDRAMTSSGTPIALRDPAAVGIPRFAEVATGLYRGARPSDEGLRYLRDRGVRSIISLRHDESERRRAAALGLRYFEIPLHAGILGSSEPTEEEIGEFLDLVADSANRPVFYHCRHGRDRTGVMTALYRIRVQGWSAEDAMEEMWAFGASRLYKDLYRPVVAYRNDPAAPAPARAFGAPTSAP
ncbi:MAG: MBL fold metallo-hydrolase [Hyphomicrobiales bacterium]